MAKKKMLFKTKGMNRDLSVSAFNPEFAFENRNLRLSTNEGNTLLSWVNEKGTEKAGLSTQNGNQEVSIEYLRGIAIGTAVINHKLILFTTELNFTSGAGVYPDHIYSLEWVNSKFTVTKICEGYLDFDTNHPLETLVSYEAENVEKVYWVDGKNQPRMINVHKTYAPIEEDAYNPFDFVGKLQLNETVHVEKILGSGMFAPGVIQYAFTYYNKYGQESNIFYTTPLQYISPRDRGGSPEEKVANSFRITVENVDENYDYLRIYSIQRTSINGTPICKRIQDIEINNSLDWVDTSDHTKGHKASYTDTGLSGDSIDSVELLYKGGEVITANTIEQKDGTLFLGNIETKRDYINDHYLLLAIKSYNVSPSTRQIQPLEVTKEPYLYYSQLTSKEVNHDWNVPCGGFKTGDKYRLGVQFQHESGKWSEPIWLEDKKQSGTFVESSGTVTLPTFSHTIGASTSTALQTLGYKRVRGCVVFPKLSDRNIVCQCVTCPTVYKGENNEDYQSSWFFRPGDYSANDPEGRSIQPSGTSNETAIPPIQKIRYSWKDIEGESAFDPYSINLRAVEIEGCFGTTETFENRYKVDQSCRTLHSPDIEFDSQLQVFDYDNCRYRYSGQANFEKTLADIFIETETPTINQKGSGFLHKSLVGNNAAGIISGLFYDDFIVDDNDDGGIQSYTSMKASAKWLVYPWQGTGSLNNDLTRPTEKGVQSAKLKKKIISNLRYASTTINHSNETLYDFTKGTGVTAKTLRPQLFMSDEISIIKYGTNIYKGNVDTLLMPNYSDGKFFAYEGATYEEVTEGLFKKIAWVPNITPTPFNSIKWCKTWDTEDGNDDQGVRCWYKDETTTPPTYKWFETNNNVGNIYKDLSLKKLPVRMKYKSTPHLFCQVSEGIADSENSLTIIEVIQTGIDDTRYGGTSNDALKENVWVPCGEPVPLYNTSGSGDTQGDVTYHFSYGDTYFQRYDCLKTYAFTPEDINQVVEIGSFMLETRVNIDGRYDRNRGQQNNLNMSPRNFNLMNPVYSQVDNFFNYKILDASYYENTVYPNQLTWSKTKENGADVDQWTNITLASVLELDGDKGKLNKLVRFNNQLLAFQDTGISHILYNENVQVSATNGVPIEIANSGKVSGKDYKSSTIGCSNKWSMVTTPNGIYFMDNHDKGIYLFNGQLNNISNAGGFNSWCKQHIPSHKSTWEPIKFGRKTADVDELSNFVGYYDKQNQDVLFINHKEALAYSEKLGVFTSFYSYGNIPFFVNLDDKGIWLKSEEIAYHGGDADEEPYEDPDLTKVWLHQQGDYCKFFDNNEPYSMTLVGNPEPQLDKIFTNLEFRASVEGDGELNRETGKFTFTLPFDSLEAWNEYQRGITKLENKWGHDAMLHNKEAIQPVVGGTPTSSLKRRFRIWRCDVPRDNAPVDVEYESSIGISRAAPRALNRLRNPWIYLKLLKNVEQEEQTVDEQTVIVDKDFKKAEIHDIELTYIG